MVIQTYGYHRDIIRGFNYPTCGCKGAVLTTDQTGDDDSVNQALGRHQKKEFEWVHEFHVIFLQSNYSIYS